MNKNQSEEKRMQFLEMQEHPEKYTDEQIEALLADENIRAFAQELAMTKRAMMRNEAGEVDVEEEWEHFSAQHPVPRQRSRMKIAASIAGVVFASGLAFAATVQLGILPFFGNKQPANPQPQIRQTTVADSLKQVREQRKAVIDSLTRTLLPQKDSIPVQPVVFENVSLKTIIETMAQYYHAEVKVLNPGAAHVRLFFKWDKQASLQQNIELLNAFDRVNLTYSDNTLTIE